MSEAAFGPEKAERRSGNASADAASKGSFEGNVRIPQIHFGTVVFGLERCFESDDPRAAIQHLIDPIPLDAALSDRTRKANAQHVRFGIQQKVLTENDVRNIQLGGNYRALRLLQTVLGHDNFPLPYPMIPASDNAEGNWALDSSYTELMEMLLSELSPKSSRFIAGLLRAAADAVRAPEAAAVLDERKEIYRTWARTHPLRLTKRKKLLADADMHAKSVIELAKLQVQAYADTYAQDEEERSMTGRFLKALEEMSPIGS